MKKQITAADVFAIKTKLKLSTLVKIACDIEKERGSSPRCTIYERQHQLATIAGHCITKADAAAVIRESLN